MSQMTAVSIALAFNQQNSRKTWAARPNSREASERVHFVGGAGNLVKLVYDVRDDAWFIQFNKVTAQWGDYVRAIARSFYVVTTTLQSAGLPFTPPPSEDDVTIICHPTQGGVQVKYEAPPTVTEAVMPEQVAAANAT